MRMRWIAAAAVSAVASPVTAAPSVWQGDATITAVTAACASTTSERQTIGVGTMLRSLFRPSGVGENGTDTRMSFVHDSQANFAIIVPGTPGATGTYVAFGVRHNGVRVSNRSGGYQRFFQYAGTITPSTTFIEYEGSIEDFLFVPGCTVSFRSSYQPRP